MIKAFCKLKKTILVLKIKKSILKAWLTLAFDRFSIVLSPILLIPALLSFFTFLFYLPSLALVLIFNG